MEKMIEIYQANYSLYQDFTNQIQQFVTAFLHKRNIRIHSVVSRVKTEASLQQKIVTHAKYTQLEDITDICGLRIITYFEDDVDKVGELLHDILAIDEKNSIDKRKLLPPNQFGYLSLHFIAGLPIANLQASNNEKFKNCKIEIQIRSILQHTWAEIEHDLGYKSGMPLSYAARRKFSRLAGLLEIADEEFSELRHELEPAPAARLAPPKSLVPKALPQLESSTQKATQFMTSLRNYLPLSKITEYPYLSATLLFIALCFAADTPHVLASIMLAMKTEKHSLFALANNYIHV